MYLKLDANGRIKCKTWLLWDAVREQQVTAEKENSNGRVIAVVCSVSGEVRE